MNKFYFIITTLCLLCISMTSMADDTSQTWSYSFYRTATNGGEGFSGSESKMTTTINAASMPIRDRSLDHLQTSHHTQLCRQQDCQVRLSLWL